MSGTYLGSDKVVQKINLKQLLLRKSEGVKISMITCYDSAFARLVDASSVDMILVGDSLGNVMMGYDSTIPVSLDNMIHHCSCVARVVKKAFVAVDMPFGTYQVSPEQALSNAIRLIQEGQAQAVKLEGGQEIAPQIAKISAAGIPVIAHLGLTPQSIHALGGYSVQGRDEKVRKKILSDAVKVQEAGAVMLVLELVPADLAKEISEKLAIPTIGIGAGTDVDGQVLVLQDMLGFDSKFNPKFLKKYAELGDAIVSALDAYHSEVQECVFPGKEHQYKS